MQKSILYLLIACGFVFSAEAQPRYLVAFKDKAFSPFSIATPLSYLSQRAIDRRAKNNTPVDSTDLPVTPRYLDSIRNVPNVIVLNVSKWFNRVSIQTSDSVALQKIKSFSFVLSVPPIANRKKNTGTDITEKFTEIHSTVSIQKEQDITADYFNYGSSFKQVHIHNGEFLHNIGLRGQEMIIGMLDAGFYHYNSLKAFDSAIANGQIVATYDFVNKKISVTEEYHHGMECLSTMAANLPGTFVGTAPKASFYLFKTEDIASEYPIEEHNWVCGAERLDSAGADVISSSLGYTGFDNPVYSHTYADLNGHTTIAAIGANLAVKKGMMVFNAVGNDGNKTWHYLSTPADADSVLAVGAVDTSGQPAAFSSYGPSASGHIKPDLASVGAGTIIAYTNDTFGPSNGTSFACPNIAGLATCLWQGFKEARNTKIMEAIRNSGSIATAPDNRIGYGIPDVKKALLILLKDFSSATAAVTNCRTSLTWTSKDVASMKYEIERKLPDGTGFIKITTTGGQGAVFSNHNYIFTDTLSNIASGTIQYRIRQIIDTAAATFSAAYIDTVSVNLSGSCITTSLYPINGEANDITISPNPARSEAFLKIDNNVFIPNLQIQIINSLGQVVASLKKSKPAHITTYSIPVASLAKGKYFISLFDGGKWLATKELIRL